VAFSGSKLNRDPGFTTCAVFDSFCRSFLGTAKDTSIIVGLGEESGDELGDDLGDELGLDTVERFVDSELDTFNLGRSGFFFTHFGLFIL
jgi:hypothetical protein